jgi:hypothetical protein
MLPLTRSRLRSRFFAIAIPLPGAQWLVLSSSGVIYVCSSLVTSSGGIGYGVVNPVLASDGTAYNAI